MSFDDIHSSSLTPTLSSLSTQVWIFLFLLFHNKSSVYCQTNIRGIMIIVNSQLLPCLVWKTLFFWGHSLPLDFFLILQVSPEYYIEREVLNHIV